MCGLCKRWAKCHKEARRKKRLRHRDFIKVRTERYKDLPSRFILSARPFHKSGRFRPLPSALSSGSSDVSCRPTAARNARLSRGSSMRARCLRRTALLFPSLTASIAFDTSTLVLTKKLGFVRFQCTPKESSSSATASAAPWSVGSRVTAKRSKSSSHSRIFRSRQSCEPNSATIVPFVSRWWPKLRPPASRYPHRP